VLEEVQCTGSGGGGLILYGSYANNIELVRIKSKTRLSAMTASFLT
jgi:hypothetical protein